MTPLGTCVKLHTLTLDLCTRLEDVSALGNCTNLHTLNLGYTKVENISPLGKLTKLHTLYLYSTRVRDVSSLTRCTNLHTLDLCRTNVREVSCLKYCTDLHILDLSGTSLVDLDSLVNLKYLHTIFLWETLNRGNPVSRSEMGRMFHSAVKTRFQKIHDYTNLPKELVDIVYDYEKWTPSVVLDRNLTSVRTDHDVLNKGCWCRRRNKYLYLS